MSKIFGTDGIRGQANIYPITSEVALALGRAVAYKARKRSNRPKIIVGKDTRLSCYMLEMAVISGICSMGADALMTGPIPTPGIGFLTKDMRCSYGVMVTASHNFFYDNGIKIFGPDGFKISDSEEDEIEEYINSQIKGQINDSFSYPEAENIGRAIRIEDGIGRYISHVKQAFSSDLDLCGMRVAVDPANGSCYKIASLVFEELGADVITINNKPDGTNINKNCGAIYPEELKKIVIEQKCDIGICLDGDGDRSIFVDEMGATINGDNIIAMLSKKIFDHCGPQTIVATVMSNLALDEFINGIGGKIVRADVGDQNVIAAMKAGGYALGGENSGHIICAEHSTTGDGIISALEVLSVMKKSNKKLSEISQVLQLYPQILLNIDIKEKIPIKDVPRLQCVVDSASRELEGKGRVLVRFSGTENVLRIMVEYKEEKRAREIANKIAEVAVAELQRY